MNPTDNNPFKAPVARVADAIPGDGDFIPDGRRVPASHGMAWISRGWAIFRGSPGVWIGIGVIFIVVATLFTEASTISALLFNLIAPILIGGIMIGCRAQEEGEELRFGHLFAGFSEHAGKLALVGLFYLIGVFAIGMIIGLTGIGVGLSGVALRGANALLTVAWTVLALALVASLLFVPLAMAIWYAPALVIFHEVSPFQALKMSFFACFKNFLPFLLYGIVLIILAILATLPVLLGWLALMPVILTSTYASYRDIFTEN